MKVFLPILILVVVISGWLAFRGGVTPDSETTRVGVTRPDAVVTQATAVPSAASGERPTTASRATLSATGERRNKGDATSVEQKNKADEDPEFREYASRQIVKDYADLFSRLSLSPEREEILSKILVERMLSPTIEERDAYLGLAAQILSERELDLLKQSVDDMPLRYAVRGALTSVGANGIAALSANARASVEQIIRNSPHNADDLWKTTATRASGAQGNESAQKAATEALAKFELALQGFGAALSEQERNRLRDWYRVNVVDFNMRALKSAAASGK